MIEIPVTPVAKPRMTRQDKWKQRPSVMRYRAYKDELCHLVKGELEPVFEVVFHIEMPKSWSNIKKNDMRGRPHQQKPDIDNLVKGLMDALAAEDSYIYSVKASKYWSDTGKIELEG